MELFKKVKGNITSSVEKKLHQRLAKCSGWLKPQSQPVSGNIEKEKLASDRSLDFPADTAVFVGRPAPDVRLVLFKEISDTSDRINIFDSKYLKARQDASGTSQKPENENIHKFEKPKCPPDWDVLGEMLFGSVGMAQKAPALKIHSIRDPPQIMISRVFCFTSLKSATLDKNFDSSCEMPKSIQVSSRRKAQTMPVQASFNHPSVYPQNSPDGFQNYDMPRSESSNSLSSLLSSSLGSGLRPPYIQPKKAHSLPQNQRNSFMLQEEFSEQVVSRLRIGFAVLCGPEPKNLNMFQNFCFERFPIIESHLTELKENIESALKIRSKAEFELAMLKAHNVFSIKLTRLYTTPRLPEPVWQTLRSPLVTDSHSKLVVRHFIGDLTRIVLNYNTKQKNNFFSGLMTAVLTYHLGWVGFASPKDEKNTPDIAKNYNALWAQIGDLYGAVGSPTKVCKTIVSGSEGQHETISTILSVLSFFIQCSQLRDQVCMPDHISPTSLKCSPNTDDLKIDYLKCDMDESEYVFVSHKDNHPPSSQASSSSCSVKKKPLSSDDYDPSSLLRRNSGPMYKKQSWLIEERQRTYSNDVKKKVVQSRRTSSDIQSKKPSLTIQSQLKVTAKQQPSNIKTNGPFCMRQQIDIKNIDWPEIPTHSPNGCNSLKHAKSSPALPQMTPRQANTVVPRVQTFVDLVEPRLEHAVQLQSACPTEPSSFINDMAQVLAKQVEPLKENPISNNTSPVKNKDCEKPVKPVPATRSKSNPLTTRSKNLNGIKRNLSSDEARAKLVQRRKLLPTSDPTSKEVPPLSDNKFEKAKLKLMRVPSVELNHNAFDEYFEVGCDLLPCNEEKCSSISESVEDFWPAGQAKSKSSTSQTLKNQMKVQPPLPAKAPVGSVSFKAASEEITFGGNPTPLTEPQCTVVETNQKYKTISPQPNKFEQVYFQELPVFDFKSNQSTIQREFSPSWDGLAADFSEDYLNDFVLHGVSNQQNLHAQILKDLKQTSRNPPVDEPVSEAVCIHADLESCSVKVYSSQRLHSDKPCLPALNSKLVSNIFQQVAHMFSLKVSPQYCMVYLESELRQLVLKSRMLAEYVRGQKRVKVAELSAVLGIESQDLPLLMAVASCHSPHVARIML